MTRRSPARLLAPLALVATVLALVLVVSSGGGNGSDADGGGSPPATTTTTGGSESTERDGEKSGGRKRKTYTVKAGDTPSAIAEKTGVPLDRLLELNPDVDPQLLSPGQKLKLQ